MRAADAGERRDEVLDRPSRTPAARTRTAAVRRGAVPEPHRRHPRPADVPFPRRDPVVHHRDPRRVDLEQLGHLGAHRPRARDQRIGPVGQPPLHRVHLAGERRRQPARVAARLGGVERRHERHVERVGERDRRVRHQPVVGVHDVRSPSAEPGQRGPQQRVTHGERPGHQVPLERQVRRILGDGEHPHPFDDRVERRVGDGVRARRPARRARRPRGPPPPARSPTRARACRGRRPPPAGTPR